MSVIIRTACGCKREIATYVKLGDKLRLPCINRHREYQYSPYERMDDTLTRSFTREFRYIGDRDVWGTPILDEIV